MAESILRAERKPRPSAIPRGLSKHERRRFFVDRFGRRPTLHQRTRFPFVAVINGVERAVWSDWIEPLDV